MQERKDFDPYNIFGLRDLGWDPRDQQTIDWNNILPDQRYKVIIIRLSEAFIRQEDPSFYQQYSEVIHSPLGLEQKASWSSALYRRLNDLSLQGKNVPLYYFVELKAKEIATETLQTVNAHPIIEEHIANYVVNHKQYVPQPPKFPGHQ